MKWKSYCIFWQWVLFHFSINFFFFTWTQSKITRSPKKKLCLYFSPFSNRIQLGWNGWSLERQQIVWNRQLTVERMIYSSKRQSPEQVNSLIGGGEDLIYSIALSTMDGQCFHRVQYQMNEPTRNKEKTISAKNRIFLTHSLVTELWNRIQPAMDLIFTLFFSFFLCFSLICLHPRQNRLVCSNEIVQILQQLSIFLIQ